MSIIEEVPLAPSIKLDSNSKSKSKKASPSLSTASKPATSTSKRPITSTALRLEHLDAAQMLLKAATVCALKEDEECENTAICVERVVADLIALTAAVAKALNFALDGSHSGLLDRTLLKRWCEFYSNELLPQTKSMMKKMSPILDTYGLFLPSRIGTSVSPELLEKGLSFIETETEDEVSKTDDAKDDVAHMTNASPTTERAPNKQKDDEDNLMRKKDLTENESHGDDLDTGRDEEEDEVKVPRVEKESPLSSTDEGAVDEYEYYDEDDLYEDEEE